MKRANNSNAMGVRKRANQLSAPHQRLWWMELVRGTITCACGLLFLTGRSFAPRAFVYSLGAYLVIDGGLELADACRKKDLSRLKVFDAAGGS